MSSGHPKRVGKYNVISVLGQGAMGVVYRAVDSGLGRQVAIKAMSRDLPTDSELRLRFLREARAVAQLQHPNIITIHELVEEHGTAYIVMELLEGASVYSLLRKKSLDLPQKLSILQQIASGVEHAHHHGIIHRDLKPSNFFVLRNGVVKVLDFGVAKVGEGDFTRAGTVFGTVEYMAPEQIRGEVVDGQADIFSLGVVSYELLTGRNPFRGETLAASVFKILSDEPGSTAKADPSVTAALDAVVQKALSKNREERFRSMGDYLSAISQAAKQMVVETRPLLLSDKDVETASRPAPSQVATAEPVVNQWSHVAAAAGHLEDVYEQGIQCFASKDYRGCAERMGQVLDQVLVHSMALHYLSQSEDRLRQERLDRPTHGRATEVLASMRRAHRDGDSERIIEQATKLLAIDPESMEARWYRRAAENRLRRSSTKAFTARSAVAKSRTSLRQSADLTPTLVVPPMSSLRSERAKGIWALGGAGVLFLALAGLFWGFAGGNRSEEPPSPEALAKNTKVRVSPFDGLEDDAVLLSVPNRPEGSNEAGSATAPAVSSVLPREVPAGRETMVRLFGRNFSPSAEVVLARGSHPFKLLASDVVSDGLVEISLVCTEQAVGKTVRLVVANPDGSSSHIVDLPVVAPGTP